MIRTGGQGKKAGRSAPAAKLSANPSLEGRGLGELAFSDFAAIFAAAMTWSLKKSRSDMRRRCAAADSSSNSSLVAETDNSTVVRVIGLLRGFGVG